MEAEETNKTAKIYDLNLSSDHIGIFTDELSDEAIKSHLTQHLHKLIDASGITGYEVLFLKVDCFFV